MQNKGISAQVHLLAENNWAGEITACQGVETKNQQAERKFNKVKTTLFWIMYFFFENEG